MSDIPNKLNNMCEMFWLGHTIRNVDMVKEAADLIEQQATEIEALRSQLDSPRVKIIGDLLSAGINPEDVHQSLAERDADAIIQAIHACKFEMEDRDYNGFSTKFVEDISISGLLEYAERVKRGDV